MSWQLTSLGFDTAKMFDYFFVREKIFRCLCLAFRLFQCQEKV